MGIESTAVQPIDETPTFTVDREKVCPMLVRVFYATGRHNSTQDYFGGKFPRNELQIYTWLDATMKELTNLIKQVNADARRPRTMFEFSIVAPAPTSSGSGHHRQRGGGHYLMKEIATTIVAVRSDDDNVTLKDKRFTIGDFLDVAVIPPGMPPLPQKLSDMDRDRGMADVYRDHRNRRGGGGRFPPERRFNGRSRPY